MFFDGNDFRDTYLGPEKYDVSTGGARWRKECLERIPVEFRSGEETKEIPRTVRQLLWDHLASYRLLSQSKSRILADWSGEARAQGASEFRVERRFLSYTFWSQVPYPEVAVESKNLSIEVFGRIHASLLSRNVRLAIVAVPFREHVYTAHEQGEGYDIRRPAVFVEDFAREHGIPYLDLLPRLREAVARDGRQLFVEGDPHLNTDGHRLVGELLHGWFRTNVEGSTGSRGARAMHEEEARHIDAWKNEIEEG